MFIYFIFQNFLLSRNQTPSLSLGKSCLNQKSEEKNLPSICASPKTAAGAIHRRGQSHAPHLAVSPCCLLDFPGNEGLDPEHTLKLDE